MNANTFIKPAIEMSEGDGVDVHRLFPVSSKMMKKIFRLSILMVAR